MFVYIIISDIKCFVSIMPTTATDHDGFQKKICGCCTLKPSSIQKINYNILALLRKHHCQDYSTDCFPSVVCKSCVKTLREIDSDSDGKGTTRYLPSIDYSIFNVPKHTRATASGPCQCHWCYLGRLNGKDYVKHQNEVKDSRGRPRSDPSKSAPAEVIKVCTACAGIIARGVSHQCSKTMRNSNLGNFIKNINKLNKMNKICLPLFSSFIIK